ncbi:MAG: hypothetical protein ABIP54_02210 [Candidatus Andersenbacteria bacterium]
MLTLEEVRNKYPQYNNRSDDELLTGLHKKYYSQMPQQEFMAKFKPEADSQETQGLEGVGEDIRSGIGNILPSAWGMLKQAPGELRGLSRQLKTPGQEMRPLQNLISGLAKGGHGILNTPANIGEYAARKGFIEPETAAKIPRQAEHDFQLAEGEQAGDALVQGLSSFLPYAGLNPTAGLAAHAIGQNENPVTAGLMPTAFKTAGKIVKTAAKSPAKITKVAKDVYEPFKKAKELEKNLSELKADKVASKERLAKSNEAASGAIKEYAPNEHATAKSNLAESLKSVSKEINADLTKRYKDFGESSSGTKRIYEPIQSEFFDKKYSLPKEVVSESTQRLIDKNIGTHKSVEAGRDPLTGQMQFKTEGVKVKPTVNGYLDLFKHLRDEASHYRKLAKGDVSYGDKQKYISQAKSIENLANDVNSKIENSLSGKGKKQYSGIQADYKDLKIPLEQKSLFKNARKEAAEIKTDKFIDSMNKLGTDRLKNRLLSDTKFRENVAKHDLISLDPSKMKSLEKALNGDFGKALPEKIHKTLSEHLETAQKEHAKIEQIKLKLEKQGLSKSEVDKKVSTYKNLVKGGLYAAAGKYIFSLVSGL